jgi:uncharacterized protein YndB with AHSA1/START domain
MDTANENTETIVQQYELAHAPSKVWRALTEPSLLGQWLMQTDMQAAKGSSFTFRMEPSQWWDGIVHCEMLEIDPPNRLSYTWRSGPAASPLDTIVTWTLEPTDNGTRLTLVHSGFLPANKFAYTGAAQGWQEKVGVKMNSVLAGIA